MKTFKDFLKEEEDFDQKITEIANLIKKDCGEFLKQRGDRHFYRGLKNLESKKAILVYDERNLAFDINTRKDRQPKDSANWLHEALGNLFKKEFGINYRTEAIFAGASTSVSSNYGKSFEIYPKGDFSYVWSPYIYDALNLDSNLLSGMLYWALPEKESNILYGWVKEVVLDTVEMSEPMRRALIKSKDNNHFQDLRIKFDNDTGDELLTTEIRDQKFAPKNIVPELLKRHGEKLYLSTDMDKIPAVAEIMIACDSYYAVSMALNSHVNAKLE